MDDTPKICVTVSADLLSHLRRLAEAQDVPVSWLVAGLVCDTMAACRERVNLTRTSRGRVLAAIRPSSACN